MRKQKIVLLSVGTGIMRAIARRRAIRTDIAMSVAKDNSWHQACLFFKKGRGTIGGQIEVNIYPNSQLGSEWSNSIAAVYGGVDIVIPANP
jgi:TRAP-type C4-dicarboxylate transport system substrate-binding protein